ncbi:MAG: hypothetical protein K5989_00705 [Lachnospiraceae bacterium]|nr:hypothetical protein [Lachnospiraceae bacterium]
MLCLGIVFIYLILLCSKVNSVTIAKPEVLISFYFYVLMIVFSAGAYVVGSLNWTIVFFPLIIFALLTSPFAIHGEKMRIFREVGWDNLSPDKYYEIDSYMMNELIEADKAGHESMVLKVPVSLKRDNNWPHPEFYGDRVAQALYRHGLISRYIKVETLPEPSLNERFNLIDY